MASGDAELARSIQLQMADIEAQLRREGYTVQREGLGVQLAGIAANQNAATLGALDPAVQRRLEVARTLLDMLGGG